MNIYAWILIAWYAVSAVIVVNGVGKQKTPTTPQVAAITLVLMGVIVWLLVLAVTA